MNARGNCTDISLSIKPQVTLENNLVSFKCTAGYDAVALAIQSKKTSDEKIILQKFRFLDKARIQRFAALSATISKREKTKPIRTNRQLETKRMRTLNWAHDEVKHHCNDIDICCFYDEFLQIFCLFVYIDFVFLKLSSTSFTVYCSMYQFHFNCVITKTPNLNLII
ncbi:hypothetical protein MAR_021539 [Mya arenaria]|uniref:Uncharacterized protein n=1 Tax=Mya arenaria TaxID=6604 RepID=A0ABY7E824_MYAAR|nr:hypothetical protein MAR_021539 [Mya arenaria]